MARCEDFPCCGHEAGCCPDFDKSGRQLNMVCTCGAKLPVNARYSICNTCLRAGDEDNEGRDEDFDDEDEDEDEDEDGEMARDHLLAQQELEDFEQADEYFGGGYDEG